MDDQNYIRKRMICLTCKGPESQAAAACRALSRIHGIHSATPISEKRISLVYSLEYLTFELIESLLKELGFTLDNNIFAVIRRGIYQYLEDTAREKMQLEKQEEQVLVCNIDEELPSKEPEKYWNNYR
jgi:hypothetical protein